MLRKPILMPPSMIDKVDKIANDRKVSFAEVVREAVDAFDGDLSMEDEALLDALADTMIKTTQEVVKKIDEVEKRLDETHAMLEAQ
jgi:competence protein ComGC